MSMIIRYIYHSGYEVLTQRYQLIFDYISGPLPLREDREKIFFVSHSHEDHYSPSVHALADKLILWDQLAYRNAKTFPLSPGDTLCFDDLIIRTSGSTDEGLSFEVETEGKRIIHAGDLNNWIWPEDSPEERKGMEEDFLNYLSLFKKYPDALLFPIDYRLKENYDRGLLQALERLEPRFLFPMHFTTYPQILPALKNELKGRVQMILPEQMPWEINVFSA